MGKSLADQTAFRTAAPIFFSSLRFSRPPRARSHSDLAASDSAMIVLQLTVKDITSAKATLSALQSLDVMPSAIAPLVNRYKKRGSMMIPTADEALERLKQGISMGAANSMVLKITQVGTVSEALTACCAALANGLQCTSLWQPG